MAAEIITKDDLQEFGEKLIDQLIGILGKVKSEPKKYLKTYQVKNLLKISSNTLQALRDDGTIPFTKVGGILYYRYEDVLNVLEGSNKGK